MTKEKLLLIGSLQLEALTDAEMWCKYLKDEYDITNISFDMKLARSSELKHVHRRLVPARLPKIIRGSLFLILALVSIFFHRGKIMVVYFEKCTILKRFFPKKKMLLDIRTLAVFQDETLNEKYNSDIREACNVYDEITVISDGVARNMKLSKYHLLPLGAECISHTNKKYTDGISLLYVGTLEGRNIDVVINGLAMFKERNKNIPVKFNIIGGGTPDDVIKIKRCILDNNLDNIVSYLGRIPHHKLQPYFDQANIGISFVPLVPHYQYQPPTKTFEYLMSGLYCIATATIANQEIINEPFNGLLIQDTADAFCASLEKYLKKSNELNQKQIMQSVSRFSWNAIVNTYLKSVLGKL